jgi:serine/threonine protein kinase
MLPSTTQTVSDTGMNTAEADKYPPHKPKLRKQPSYRSCESSSIVLCPGKAASRRLTQFEQSWIRRSARSINTTTNDEIMEIHPDDLLVKRILGNGGFSTVTRVYIRNRATGHFESEQSYAMKKLRIRKACDLSFMTTAASDLGLETKILKNLSHENIIKLRGVKAGDMIESLKQGSFFIIVDELVETLDDRLERWSTRAKKLFHRRHATVSTNRRLREVAVGVANGMAYLHSKKIMFR